MKRSLLLILCLLFFSQSFAQKYQIYSFDRKVMVKKNGYKWQSAKQRMTLEYKDSVKVFANSNIKLLEVSSNQIFEWKESGTYRVEYIIKECRKRQADWLSRLFTKLYENFTGEQPKFYWTTGATKKGDNDYPLERVLAQRLKKYAQNKPTKDTRLIVETISLNNKESYLNIKNNTSEILYINVMVWDTKEVSPEPVLLYNIQFNLDGEKKWVMLPAQPHSDLPLSEFVISEKDGFEYIVFGTTKPFGIDAISRSYNGDTSNDINNDEFGDIIIGTMLE